MNILYFLIPLSVVLFGLGIWLFVWAMKSGQYDDLEGPAHRILMDDENVTDKHKTTNKVLDNKD